MTAGSSLGSSPMGCCLMAARAKRGPDEPRARPMNPTAISIRLNRREWAGLPTAKFEPSLLWGSSAYSPQTKLHQLKVHTDPTVQIQRTQAAAARRTAAKRGEVRSASQSLVTYRIKSQLVQSIIGTTLGETPALVKKGRTRVGKPTVFPCAGLFPADLFEKLKSRRPVWENPWFFHAAACEKPLSRFFMRLWEELLLNGPGGSTQVHLPWYLNQLEVI